MKITKTNFAHLFLLGMVLMSWVACVPTNKYRKSLNEVSSLRVSTRAAQEDARKCKEEFTAQKKSLDEANKAVALLQNDTLELGKRYRQIKRLNDDLNVLYEKVIAQNKELMRNASDDRQKLSEELLRKERDLTTLNSELKSKENTLKTLEEQLRMREAAMKSKEEELKDKEAKIAGLSGDKQTLEKNLADRERKAKELEMSLAEREKRVKELQDAMDAQRRKNQELKAKINDALRGFRDNELTVTERDGKVYVSLSQELLFASGSKSIDPKGKDAISKLGSVLNKNTDISITIEGHTDDVGEADMNWDLSVGRATSVVKELTRSGVEPSRIIASGRGEHIPVASNTTNDGKAKNRRTEIILMPNIGELYKILND